MEHIYSLQQEVGYRISDSPSDNPTIKKSDNPLPFRALQNRPGNLLGEKRLKVLSV